jgi:hypothetical protein
MTNANKHPPSTANSSSDDPAQLGFIRTAASLDIVAKIKMADPALPERPPLTLAYAAHNKSAE